MVAHKYYLVQVTGTQSWAQIINVVMVATNRQEQPGLYQFNYIRQPPIHLEHEIIETVSSNMDTLCGRF